MTSAQANDLIRRVLIGFSGLCVLAVAFLVLPWLIDQPGSTLQSGRSVADDPAGLNRSAPHDLLSNQPGRGAGFHPPHAAAMSAIDSNKDGEISAEELARAPEALKRLDKNADGSLTGDEILQPIAVESNEWLTVE